MKSIPELQEIMKNPDPHFRTNAVIDLGKYYEDESLRSKLTEQEKSTVVKMLIDCLNPKEKSIEVKSKTTNIFKKISIYLKETEISPIFQESVKYITTPGNEGKDIFADCLKSILEKIPETFCDTIGKIILEPLSKGLDSKDKETLILCVDLLSKYIEKFDYLLLKENCALKIDKPKYITVALNNILDKDETLRNRSFEFLETL